MGLPAHFYHIMVPSSWKLYAGKFFGNYMQGNFLETICWEFFWKLYAGKFFGNYMLGNLGGYQRFLRGVLVLAQFS